MGTKCALILPASRGEEFGCLEARGAASWGQGRGQEMERDLPAPWAR